MRSIRSYPAIPEGWEVLQADGVGPFRTRLLLRRVDGSVKTWESRRHRRCPGRLSRIIGWLFAVGSFCFLLGSLPPYFQKVSPGTDALTFAAGSVCFTAAAVLQYLQAVNAPQRPDGGAKDRPWRFLAWQPQRIDFWVTGVQLVGTGMFNISTFSATVNLSTQQAERLVWAPDVFGSVAFLVASALAWWEICHSWWRWQPNRRDWWIAAVNLLGSVFFGLSALGAFILPTTGEMANIEVVNLATGLGAVCFLIGGLLLVAEGRGAAQQGEAAATPQG